MTIIPFEKSQAALTAYIERKKQKEFKHSFEISHEQRENCYYAWLHAKRMGFPFNTFLQFLVPVDNQDQRNCAKKIREVAHHVLMFCRRNGKVPSYVMWTRFVSLKEPNLELNSLICHIPPKLYNEFRAYARKWSGLDIEVNPCDYQKHWEVDDYNELITVFDDMFRATSKETRYKLKNVYSEESDVIFRPRVFSSKKLDREEIRAEMQAQSIAQRIEINGVEDLLR